MNPSALASVVFLKIHDFARRPVSEQARLRAQLEAVLAVTVAQLAPRSRIVLDAPDGAAVVVLGDARGALRVAEQALAAGAAGLPLCAGLNHGAVRLARNGNGEEMSGDGIAVAASLAGFAAPAGLRTSRAFRDALADAVPGLEASLAPAGSARDASLRSHELYQPDPGARGRRRRRYAMASLAAVLALVAAGLGWRISAEGQDAFLGRVKLQGERYMHGLAKKVNLR
jgi:hypothetical protein